MGEILSMRTMMMETKEWQIQDLNKPKEKQEPLRLEHTEEGQLYLVSESTDRR